MIEASKTTREIQKTVTEESYTLTLSGEDVAKFGQEYSNLVSAASRPVHVPTLIALRRALANAPTSPAPLANGDQVRLTRNNPRNAYGNARDHGTAGDVGEVIRAQPDEDGEILVDFAHGGTYLAASGLYAADWERVAPLTPGDEIRILRHRHNSADVRIGDVLTVKSVEGIQLTTDAPRGGHPRRTWVFLTGDEGTGWERV